MCIGGIPIDMKSTLLEYFYHSGIIIIDVQLFIYIHSMSNRQNRVFHTSHGMKPVNLTDIWEDLSTGIHHIYSRQSMPKKRYMGLYTYPTK